MTAFDSARDEIRDTLARMRALRHRLELSLAGDPSEPWRVVDAAEVFAGPSARELHQAKDAAEPPPPPRTGERWWDEEMAKNWPDDYRRRNPGWSGRRRW